MTIYSSSESETEAAGARLAQMLGRGGVAALSGELGAGKTAFVRGLAEGLGIAARVTSPTFAIVNEYDGPIPLFHFDMYRISARTSCLSSAGTTTWSAAASSPRSGAAM